MEEIDSGAAVCPHCGKSPDYMAPPSHLKPGTVLRGKYVIGRALGQGGFGITYIGRDTALDTPVAIKEYFWRECAERNSRISNAVTLSDLEQKDNFEEGKDRFIKEARTLAKFRDEPSVVSVWDVFEENNTAYLVMEYLRGTDLGAYLRNRGRMSAGELFPKLRPIIRALDEIHKQGIIHRDIKPQNIMFMSNGRLKLLDFGAARKFGGDRSLTAILSPGFAPEEQYRKKGKQGPWTDVYALCATVYYCLTKTIPEDARDRAMEDEDELEAPSALGASISKREEAAVMQGLSIRGMDRFQSMSELEAALYAAGEEKKTPPPAPAKKPKQEAPDSGFSIRKEKISIADSVTGPAVPDEQTIDIVFCVDISKRMIPHMETVKDQMAGFVQEMRGKTQRRYPIRGRLILFSSLPADQHIYSTKFFDCEKELSRLRILLGKAARQLAPDEDGDYASLPEALSDAMNSPWGRPAPHRSHIILLWSNGMTRDEGEEKSLAAPRSLDQLAAMWKSDIMDQNAEAMIVFAPASRKGDWVTICNTWPNFLLCPCREDFSIDDDVLPDIAGILSEK